MTDAKDPAALAERLEQFGRLRTDATFADKDNPQRYARPSCAVTVDYGASADRTLTVGDIHAAAAALRPRPQEPTEQATTPVVELEDLRREVKALRAALYDRNITIDELKQGQRPQEERPQSTEDIANGLGEGLADWLQHEADCACAGDKGEHAPMCANCDCGLRAALMAEATCLVSDEAIIAECGGPDAAKAIADDTRQLLRNTYERWRQPQAPEERPDLIALEKLREWHASEARMIRSQIYYLEKKYGLPLMHAPAETAKLFEQEANEHFGHVALLDRVLSALRAQAAEDAEDLAEAQRLENDFASGAVTAHACPMPSHTETVGTRVAHSKSEYKRLKTMGANVLPPSPPSAGGGTWQRQIFELTRREGTTPFDRHNDTCSCRWCGATWKGKYNPPEDEIHFGHPDNGCLVMLAEIPSIAEARQEQE